MELFKITIGKVRSEFSVVGVANVAKNTVKYQGQLNGIPFTQSSDYELVRSRVMKAAQLNNPERGL